MVISDVYRSFIPNKVQINTMSPSNFVGRANNNIEYGIIGSGNSLMPLGNKPLPESMVTKIKDGIWGHYTAMS